ncbi:hypothetical protein RQM47_08810 [Rubrivirga sp. S365]|uniref:CHRD domain-containing protein n=1 Tax=Rubrivirga litoralis TaxID=3075598 RepID=A0ABU3BTG4_9BACT|nr:MULTISPECIES: hypothetical protein [unclassified Rubrivirga]MDT0632572.1 hypothetical protein [Rubrivirga sp. F394]MDT7856738.1 hypothetical protein [Rubrivirga sp. S365]
MKTLAFPLLAALVALPVLSGCDSNDDDETTYDVQFTALNNSGVTGTAELTMDDNDFTVEIDADDLDATVHPQHIHGAPGGTVTAQAVCPTMADDANADGFVDVLEGLPRYGAILLPLDDDISTQAQNVSGFPTGTSIDYSESTSVVALRSALVKDDSDTSDPIGTLGADGIVDLDDYVIVIHGTNDELPASVGTLPGLPSQATLPVACGRITRS